MCQLQVPDCYHGEDWQCLGTYLANYSPRVKSSHIACEPGKDCFRFLNDCVLNGYVSTVNVVDRFYDFEQNDSYQN